MADEKEVEKEAGSEGLSLRDSIEVAIAATESRPADGADKTEEAPAVKEEAKEEPKKEEALIPPAEWSAEEKELFSQGSLAQQKAALRLHEKRKSTLDDIKREAADLQWAKEVAKEVEPYLRSVGSKKKPHEAIVDALRMRREFDEGDPKVAAAAYLKAKGIEVPEGLLQVAESNPVVDEKITTLQKEIDGLKLSKAQEEHQRATHLFGQAFNEFAGTKNAAGKPRFPSVNDTPEGLKISSNVGSLVGGQTELSKQFIAHVKERFPDASILTLFEEAYKYSGGKVDDSVAPKSQDTQKHIANSSRAASSIPGKGGQSGSSSNVKKYSSIREAAAAALSEIREREGN